MDTREYVKSCLDMSFEGSGRAYTIFCVLGGTRKQVEDFLVESIEKSKPGYRPAMVTMEEDENGYSFVIWDEFPAFAEDISRAIPDTVVIGDHGWDYHICEIYKNGKEAVKNTDYTFALYFEETDDDSDDADDTYYDTEWTVTDNQERVYQSGGGMVSEGDLQCINVLATEIHWKLPER